MLCPLVILGNNTENNENSGTGSRIRKRVNCFGSFFFFFNFCLKERLKDELPSDGKQLFTIPTEDRARENGPKALSEKNEVRYKKEDGF